MSELDDMRAMVREYFDADNEYETASANGYARVQHGARLAKARHALKRAAGICGCIACRNDAAMVDMARGWVEAQGG